MDFSVDNPGFSEAADVDPLELPQSAVQTQPSASGSSPSAPSSGDFA